METQHTHLRNHLHYYMFILGTYHQDQFNFNIYEVAGENELSLPIPDQCVVTITFV